MPELKTATLVFVVIAALLGGMAGAAASWALHRAEPGPAKKSKAAGEDSALAIDDLAERIDALEGELRAVRSRNQSTDALRQYARALNKADTDSNRDAGDSESERSVGIDGMEPVLDAEDPTFELAVRTVLDRVDWERQEERRVDQTRRREERAQRQTELLAERLKLSPPQRERVQQILTEQMETFRNLRSGENPESPRPATRNDWRARVESIRTDTEKKLREVLDDAQIASYRQFVEEEGFGSRAGRSRRGAQ
jgi:hypothetical protein